MLPPLVSVEEATQLGFDLTETALTRASIRIRGYLRQMITVDTSTIVARGPIFRLPERPVQEVHSVTSADHDDNRDVPYRLDGSLIRVDTLGRVQVVYTHGYAKLPDELVELTCQAAERIEAATNSPTGRDVAAGIRSESVGPYSIGFGWDAYKAQSGLAAGEKETLRRYFPNLPNPITVGRPA